MKKQVMELRRQLVKEITLPAIVLLALMILTSFVFFYLNGTITSLITQGQPAQQAMEHMTLDVYEDNLLLIEYLNTKTYSQALKLDTKVKASQRKCQDAANNIENLIISKKLTDNETIALYNQAKSLHVQVEQARDSLLELHKKELATNKKLTSQKEKILENHTLLLSKAIHKFSQTSSTIETRNQHLQKQLLIHTQVFTALVFILIIIFIATLIYKFKIISKRIIDPLDQTISSTRAFVQGDYGTKIKPEQKIPQIAELQENINHVFAVINTASKKSASQKDSIDKQLLKKEYIDILEFVKYNAQSKRKVNISVIKKHFSITHPTALERLRSLEKRGFITFEKEGREKFITLTGKY